MQMMILSDDVLFVFLKTGFFRLKKTTSDFLLSRSLMSRLRFLENSQEIFVGSGFCALLRVHILFLIFN